MEAYTGPTLSSVHTTRIHRPCSRPVNTGVIFDTRVQNTGVILDTRVHGPCWSPVYPTRPVNTGSVYRALSL